MEKRELTAAKLADSLKSLYKKHGSFDRITVSNIADAAGVTRPTFYRYFSDKHALLEWIFQHDVILPARPLLENGMSQEAVSLILLQMEKDRELYTRAIRIKGQNSFESIVYHALKELILDIFQDKLAPCEPENFLMTPENLAKYFANSFTFVIISWLESGMKRPAKEVAALFVPLTTTSLEVLLNGGQTV